jgi:hypothetical protein
MVSYAAMRLGALCSRQKRCFRDSKLMMRKRNGSTRNDALGLLESSTLASRRGPTESQKSHVIIFIRAPTQLLLNASYFLCLHAWLDLPNCTRTTTRREPEPGVSQSWNQQQGTADFGRVGHEQRAASTQPSALRSSGGTYRSPRNAKISRSVSSSISSPVEALMRPARNL